MGGWVRRRRARYCFHITVSVLSVITLILTAALPVRLEVASAQQSVLVFQQGYNNYAGATDAQLRSDRPKRNYGAGAVLTVQADNWILSAVRFDLSAVSPNATVSKATLELLLSTKNDAKSFTMSLYPLLRPWSEVSVTWNQAASGTNWASPGANKVGVDRGSTSVSSALVQNTGSWYQFDVTSAVQGWLSNPGSNYGLVLRGNSVHNTEFRFASSNDTNVSVRPKLTLWADVPVAGSTATPTPTAVPGTPTPTATVVPATPTATGTPVPATSTPTATAVPATPTPTATPTVAPATSTPTPTSAPGAVWRPALNTPWQWMIDHALNLGNAKDMGTVDPNGNPLTTPPPQVYDIDGFYNGYDPNRNVVDKNGNYNWNDPSYDQVALLHALGKKVICYIDAGVYENYRPDAYKFPASVIGNADSGWNGSYWMDIRRTDILGPIMLARMKMCKDKGFDAIEPDEIDGYSNNSGFPLTYQDQINYNRFIADMAHSLGMSIGLKGDIDQVKDLVNYFDWTLNEECFQYNECSLLMPFTNAGKAVFQAEYKGSLSNFCPTADKNNWNAMLMPLNLDGGRWPCR